MERSEYYFQIEAKTVEVVNDGVVIIEGMASTKDLDRYNDIVEPSAFAGALEMYMKNPALLRSHYHDEPCGRVLSVKVTNEGLFIRAEVTEARTVEDVKAGRMGAFSIGYIPKEWEVLNPEGEPFNPDKDNPWNPDNIRVIKALDLVEISIVSVPANGNALFTLAKSIKQANEQNALIIMKSMSMTKKNIPANELEEEKKTASAVAEKAAEEEAADAEEAKEEESAESTEEKTETAEEETEEKAAEGTENTSEDGETESTESSEESENAEEGAAADSTEGGDAEEVNADDEPVEEGDEESSEEGKALLLVDAKTLDALPMFKEAGLIRLAGEGEKSVDLSEEVKSILAQSQMVIDSLKKSYEDLADSVKHLPAKKALAPHRQLEDADEKTVEQEKSEEKKQPGVVSKGFARLFPDNVFNK